MQIMWCKKMQGSRRPLKLGKGKAVVHSEKIDFTSVINKYLKEDKPCNLLEMRNESQTHPESFLKYVIINI